MEQFARLKQFLCREKTMKKLRSREFDYVKKDSICNTEKLNRKVCDLDHSIQIGTGSELWSIMYAQLAPLLVNPQKASCFLYCTFYTSKCLNSGNYISPVHSLAHPQTSCLFTASLSYYDLDSQFIEKWKQSREISEISHYFFHLYTAVPKIIYILNSL